MRNIAVDLLDNYRREIIALQEQCVADLPKKTKLNIPLDKSELDMTDDKINITSLKDKFSKNVDYLVNFQRDLADQLSQSGTKAGILNRLKYYGNKRDPLQRIGLDRDKEWMIRLTMAMLPDERPKLSKIHACVIKLNQYLDAREDLERKYDTLVRKFDTKQTTSLSSSSTATTSATNSSVSTASAATSSISTARTKTHVPALPNPPAPIAKPATSSSSSTSANDPQFHDVPSSSHSASASPTNSPRAVDVDTPRTAFSSESPRSAISESTDTETPTPPAPAASNTSVSSKTVSTPAESTTQTWIFAKPAQRRAKQKNLVSTKAEPSASTDKEVDIKPPVKK